MGNFAKVRPGDVVCLAAGERRGLTLVNFKGTAEAPILFINYGGKVRIDAAGNNGDIGIKLYGSQHVQISGAGDPGIQYGIEIANGENAAVDTNHPGQLGATDGTEYVELDHIYAHDVGAGFRIAKNNELLNTSVTWSGHQYYIHDNYIQNTVNEGMYIGPSDTGGTFPIYDVRVWNNRIENAGYDGIQIRQAHATVLVHDNIINGTGRDPCKNGTIDNTAGFNIAAGTDTGDWYNNTVIGARTAFYIKQAANVRVYNNLALNSGHATSGLTGPECPKDVTGTKAEGAVQIMDSNNVQFMFNTLVNTTVNAEYGIRIKRSSGTVQDNIVAGAFSSLITGSGMDLANNLMDTNIGHIGFVDPEGNNWRLTGASPAVDAGGSNWPPTDMDGVSRPQGKAPDIGAYEYH